MPPEPSKTYELNGVESGVPRLSESDAVVNVNDDDDVEVDAGERDWWLEDEALFGMYREDFPILLGKSLDAFGSIELISLGKGLEQKGTNFGKALVVA